MDEQNKKEIYLMKKREARKKYWEEKKQLVNDKNKEYYEKNKEIINEKRRNIYKLKQKEKTELNEIDLELI